MVPDMTVHLFSGTVIWASRFRAHSLVGNFHVRKQQIQDRAHVCLFSGTVSGTVTGTVTGTVSCTPCGRHDRAPYRAPRRRHSAGTQSAKGACLPAGCLAAWLLGCLAAWVLGCLAAWLPGCLVAWLNGCLAAWLPGRLSVWLFGCLAAWQLGCLPGCLAGCLAGCFAASLLGCLAAWSNARARDGDGGAARAKSKIWKIIGI